MLVLVALEASYNIEEVVVSILRNTVVVFRLTVGSGRFGFKITETESDFGSIPNVGTVESNRFQKLEPKSDPTVNLFIYIRY